MTIEKKADGKSVKPHYKAIKLGNTTYNVSLFFSETNKEDIKDKIARLIKNDPQNH